MENLKLKLPTLDQLRTVYEKDLIPSFPPEELRPLRSMEKQWKHGQYQPWCLFDDAEDIVGECFLWLGNPGWAIVDYLCVSSGYRNGGIGALMLAEIQKQEPGLVLFGESEAPENAPDPDMATRRLAFYARNGLKTAGYDTDIFGAHYKTLYMSDHDVADEDLMVQHQFLYQRRLSADKYDRYVHIPWDPSTPLSPKVTWTEDDDDDDDDD